MDINEELQEKEAIIKRQEGELEEAYEKLDSVISMSGIIFCEYDIEQEIFRFRTDTYKKIGLKNSVMTIEEVENDMVTILPEDNYKSLAALAALQNGAEYVEIECRMWTEKGYRQHKGVYRTIGEQEEPKTAVICFYDIDEVPKQNDGQAEDTLTGFYGRRDFEEIVLKKAAKQHGAFLLVDVDNFKRLNDNYGHDFGDEVITYVSSTLREIFLKDAYIARMGGDEFAVYISDMADREKLMGEMEKFYYLMDSFSEMKDKNISCSAGIAFWEEGDTFDSFYKKADGALYMAKYLGKAQYFVYGDNISVTEM